MLQCEFYPSSFWEQNAKSRFHIPPLPVYRRDLCTLRAPSEDRGERRLCEEGCVEWFEVL